MNATKLPPPLSVTFLSTLAALLLAGCADFSLPARDLQAVPQIESLEPRAAYGGEYIEIVGRNFDPIAENNQVLFQDGNAARAELSDGNRLRILVPYELDYTGPLIVTTPAGSSEPSPLDFVPLGAGHPIFGSPVADVRLRHQPVGLVDTEETVLLASTLFDLLVTDFGGTTRLDGRPVAMARAAAPGRALLSLRTADGEGLLLEVDARTGTPLASSEPGSTRVVETILLAGPAGAPTTTVGVDAYGSWWLSRWSNDGGLLVPARYRLAATSVAGGALDSAGTPYLAATVTADGRTESGLFRFEAGKLERVWAQDEAGHAPSGAVAISRTGQGEIAVLGLDDGDLGFVDLAAGTFEHAAMVSFGTVGALTRGAAEGKVVLAKPADGAIYQYDVATRQLDWTVQLRGQPSVLDVAAGLDEVAVGNAEENGVDLLRASTGTWLGRVSFGLGLGSADDGAGGAVAPYSYDPDEPQRDQQILVLARSVGLVLSFSPDTLELLGHFALDPSASEPQRLVVTPDLQTLVVHRQELGLVEPELEQERIVTVAPFGSPPVSVVPMADGRVIVGASTAIDVLEWNEAAMLERTGGVTLGEGRSLAALAAYGEQLLAIWRTARGFGGGLWTTDGLRSGGEPVSIISLPGTYGDFLGLMQLESGPAALFGQSALPGPAVVPFDSLLLADPQPELSTMGGATVLGTTPDGRLAICSGESAGEQLVRLSWYEAGYGLWPYTTYRLERKAAGPTCDPTGLWMYIPVPELDTLSVMQ